MRKIVLVGLTLFIYLLLVSCTKDNVEDNTNQAAYVPTPYSLRIPSGFPPPYENPANPLTEEGVRLGRMLFHDPILSSNGLTCSTCHPQNQSFAVPFKVLQNEKVSIPPLINLAWNPEFTWNGAVELMEHVPLADFGPDFFNTNMDTLVQRIKTHALYPRYFYEATGIRDVGVISHSELQHQIARVLIQFVRTLVADNSKFDRVMRHETGFTPEESSGSLIYYTERGDCFHCHGTPLLTNNLFHNTGLDETFSGRNFGRYLVTANPADMGKFSAPSLRNVELTAPYMHDSRFETLEEVIEFYNSGVHWNSPNIDPVMTKPGKEFGLQLSTQEKAHLLAFLKTFTDTTILHHPAYSNPF